MSASIHQLQPSHAFHDSTRLTHEEEEAEGLFFGTAREGRRSRASAGNLRPKAGRPRRLRASPSIRISLILPPRFGQNKMFRCGHYFSSTYMWYNRYYVSLMLSYPWALFWLEDIGIYYFWTLYCSAAFEGLSPSQHPFRTVWHFLIQWTILCRSQLPDRYMINYYIIILMIIGSRFT